MTENPSAAAGRLQLARTLRLDESDELVFPRAAAAGEWAIPGGFEFSNWTEADLVGKARQAFANGWLGLESFGRATLVAVTPITPEEVATLTERLAAHFVECWGAPSLDEALPVARAEIDYMLSLCAEQEENTLLALERVLEPGGVRERFRALPTETVDLADIAAHGTIDPIGKD